MLMLKLKHQSALTYPGKTNAFWPEFIFFCLTLQSLWLYKSSLPPESSLRRNEQNALRLADRTIKYG